jgi:hypothetical protein
MWLGFAFVLFNALSSLSRRDFYGWFRAIGIRSFHRMREWSSRRSASVMESSEIDGADGCFSDERLIDSSMARGGVVISMAASANACEDESSFHHDRASRRKVLS